MRSNDYDNHTLTVGRSVIRLKGLTTDGDPLTIGVKDGVICPDTAASGSRKDRGVTEPCIRQIRIAKTQDPFRRWDSKPAKTKQTDQRVVRAIDLQGEVLDAVPGLSRYTAGGIMLMGIEKKTGEPVVSGKLFSPLTRADATRIDPGQRKEIGRLLDISSRDLALQDVALFLLESQIVTTYWHVESVICLVAEEDSAGIYKAFFKGIHKYFTNSYNEEKLSFVVAIDRTTGAITLEGI